MVLPRVTASQMPTLANAIYTVAGGTVTEIDRHRRQMERVWGPAYFQDLSSSLDTYLDGGSGLPAAPVGIADSEDAARAQAVRLQAELDTTGLAVRDRHLYYAGPDATALVLAGSSTPADTAVTVADLPTPSGLAYFDRDDTDGFFLAWHVYRDRLLRIQLVSKAGMNAFLTQDTTEGWEVAGYRYLPIATTECVLSLPDTDDSPEAVRMFRQNLYVARPEDSPAVQLMYPDIDGKRFSDVLLSFANMLRQTNLLERETLDVPTRRLGGGPRRLEDRQVTYLSYRPRTPSGEPKTAGTRHYSHRWMVRGHWKRQWYPSENRHHPIWIEQYVAGPDDAPIKVPDKVVIV
ncbi:hypothetical protein [Rhodococcus oryzae]|uniref:hypothetical protein n=1 Tax=Rhodococcus oryzae TaxID=2571143 RepID=UPI0037930D81